MIKKIEIAGVKLDNYSVRELLTMIEKTMDSSALKTIEEVTMGMILAAEKDEQYREIIEGLDYSILSEIGILSAIGETSLQRRHEVEESSFFYEFFKRLERNKKSIFIIGETVKKIQEIQEVVKDNFPNIQIVGTKAEEECVGALDAMVNDINVATPDVIFSVMPSPNQENFLRDYKSLINATIWYGVGDEKNFATKKTVWKKIKNAVKFKQFKKTVIDIETQKIHREEVVR